MLDFLRVDTIFCCALLCYVTCGTDDARSFSEWTRTAMSDSATTRRQLKIKAGVVKRFVVLHVVNYPRDTDSIPCPDNRKLDTRKN
jgi:hypothetical protein